VRFVELRVERFNRFKKPFMIPLSGRGLVLVEGENRDQGGSNGAGKSLVWETLLWCLYGRMARYGDRQIAAQASHPQYGADVTVTFDLAEYRYRVQRSRTAKGSPEFRVDVASIADGMVYDFEPLRGVSRDPRRKLDDVADLLGFDYTSLRAAIILQGVGTELARAGFAAQMSVLESVLRLSELSAASDIGRKHATAISTELATAQGGVRVWERSVQTAEADLRDAISAASSADIAARRKHLEEGIRGCEGLSRPLNKVEAEEGDLARGLQILQRKYGEVRAQWQGALNAEQKIKTDMSKSVCPTCLRPFKKGDTKALAKHLRESTAAVQKAKTTLDKIHAQVTTAESGLEHVAALVRMARSAAAELARLQGELRTLDAQAALRAEAVETAKTRLVQAKATLAESAEKAQEIGRRHWRKTFWVEGYGRDGLQADLFNAGVPQLNLKAREFSERLTRGALTVEFDPFRGKQTEDLIRIGGVSAQTYDGLSSGEKQKADVIIAFAFRALARWRLPEPVNLTVCDEVFDHVDPEGLELVARILWDSVEEGGSGSTFVVTHNPAMKRLFPGARMLRVVREGGEATVLNM